MGTNSIQPLEPLVFIPKPGLAPPVQSSGIIGWLRINLFNSWLNTILTLVGMGFIWFVFPPIISWTIIDASWTYSPSPCPPDTQGACWAFVMNKFRVLMAGLYPEEFLWRPVTAAGLFTGLSVLTALRLFSAKYLIPVWYTMPLILFWIINGGMGLAPVEQSLWGGLMLSTGLASTGILFSLPLGILLALGRRSDLAIIKSLCVTIIEAVRGVPLITILFMASVMLPIFLPQGVDINNLLRVQIGIILFSSAYIAEVVRGGLQAVPPGQKEAADALGLGKWKTTFLIVLPQALRHVVPSLIGRCVALFKDTSLVIIVGLLDFLGMIKASAQDPLWLGYDAEAYVFCGFIYWLICFSMSRYGRSIEKHTQW